MSDASNPHGGSPGVTSADLELDDDSGETVTIGRYASAPRPVLPFGGNAPQPAPAAPPPAVPFAPAPAVPNAAPPAASPWSTRAPMPAGIVPPVAPPSIGDRAPGSQRSAFEASYAASGAAPWSTPRPLPPPIAAREPAPMPSGERDAFHLVWFDESAMPGIRRVPRWKPLLAALASAPFDPELEEPPSMADPVDLEERREVFEIAVRGTPSDARAVPAVLQNAVRADGKFAPTLMLVAGEVETPFDELARLEATVAVATPLATSDDPELEAALEAAQRFTRSRGNARARSMARALTTRIREAFAKEKKLLVPQLDEHVQRTLCEERAFQRREVLGSEHVRLLLRDGKDSDAQPLVLYAPAAVARKLPMLTRFFARIIAEVNLPADEAETAPAALRVLALVRRASVPQPG